MDHPQSWTVAVVHLDHLCYHGDDRCQRRQMMASKRWIRIKSCDSARSKSRLRKGELVEFVRHGTPKSPGNRNVMIDGFPHESCILIRTEDNRWFGWMLVGHDIEIEEINGEAQ